MLLVCVCVWRGGEGTWAPILPVDPLLQLHWSCKHGYIHTCAATPQHHCSELYLCCNTATPLQWAILVLQHRNTIAVSYTCAATLQHHCSEPHTCAATPQHNCSIHVLQHRNTTAVSYTCAATPLQYTCTATLQHHCSELYMCCNTIAGSYS